jgi:hypothetical protein
VGICTSSPTVSAPSRWATATARKDNPAASSAVEAVARFGGGVPVLLRVLGGEVRRARRGLGVHRGEQLPPGLAYRPGGGGPLVDVAVQRGAEEPGERLAQARVEQVRGDRNLVDELGIGTVIAPGRQLQAGHLVQGDRDGAQLGGLVVGGAAVGAQERVAVAPSPRQHVRAAATQPAGRSHSGQQQH